MTGGDHSPAVAAPAASESHPLPDNSPIRPRPARNPISAGGWSGLSFILGNLIGSLGFIPLARLLDPHDFGLFAEANLVYFGATLLAETAVGQALIQSHIDPRGLVRPGLYLSLAIGLIAMIGCAMAAPLMARIYHADALVPILLVLAPAVLATAAGAVPHAVLARGLDFQRKALPETLSVAASSATAVAGALAGFGVFALAVATVLSAVVSSVAAWIVAAPALRQGDGQGTEPGAARDLARMTGTIAAGDMALYVRLNTDYALTGRLLGADALGVYSLAWQTSTGPQLYISAFTGRVGFAVFSRLQREVDRLRTIFRLNLRLVAAAVLPVSAGAIGITPDLVPAVLGDRWRAVAGPLAVLFVLQMVRTICAPGASLVLAVGRGRLYAAIGLAVLPATVAAVLFGTRWGVTGVAWGMLTAVGTASALYLVTAMRVLRMLPRQLVSDLAYPAIVAAGVLLTVVITRLGLSALGAGSLVRLIVSVLAGVGVLGLAGWASRGRLRADVSALRYALAEAA